LLKFPRDGRVLRVATRHAGAPVLHLREQGSDAILLYEVLVAEEYRAIASLGLDPRNILDIGANIGLASFYLRTHFPNARLFGIEPSAKEMEILKMNYESWGNGVLLPMAAGDTDGIEVDFGVDAERTGGQHVVKGGATGEWKTEKILQRRVDRLIDEGTVLVPDLVKIDIEGAEVDALKGFGEYLAAPRAYIFETHSEELHQGCIDLLGKAGYKILQDKLVGRETRILCMVSRA